MNKNKNKGSAYERSIVDYLRSVGFTVDRTRAGWTDDRGDIHGVAGPGGPFTFECKNHRTLDLPAWYRELDVEIANNGGSVGAVIHKRHGVTDAAEQHVSLPLRVLVQLLREAGYK